MKDVCDIHALESNMVEVASILLKVGLMRSSSADRLQIIGGGSAVPRKVFELVSVGGKEHHNQ